MKKIKEFILRWLGIDTILVRLKRIDNTIGAYDRKLRENHSFMCHINDDNKVILDHLKFLNSNFFAAADVAGTKHDCSSVVIIRKRTHVKDEVVFYEIQTRDVDYVMNIMRGFGRKNTAIDSPMGWNPKPKSKFRF